MNQNRALPIPPQRQEGPGIPVPTNPSQQPQPQQQQQSSPAAKTEDDDGGTTSIDTFQEYKPTALPWKVVKACNEWYSGNDNPENRVNSGNSNHTSKAVEQETNSGEAMDNSSTNTNQNDKTHAVIDLTEENANQEPELETKESTQGTTSTTSIKDPSTQDLPPSSASLQVPSHTSSACESALLSSVVAPMVPEETAECLLPLLSQEASSSSSSSQEGPPNQPPPPPPLSPLQLEGVLLAIQRHRRVHHHHHRHCHDQANAVRAGFFLGDGAGIGKGRQISAILRDGFCRGRTRHVWLSVSRELLRDAQRDLHDVGLHCAKEYVHDGTTFLGGGGSWGGGGSRHTTSKGLGRKDKGVLFLTYNLLVSANRIEQIIAWCAGTEHLRSAKSQTASKALEEAFDGCIVFDEAHKAKNLADNTKTAQLVLMLQRRLPMARVVYCSATGVSEIDQLAYAERLGLWQVPTQQQQQLSSKASYEIPQVGSSSHAAGSFADFAAFRRSLEKRGLGSLELLALELKTKGSFMARTLSWEGAEFQTATVPLDGKQQRVYDGCVSWWNKCQKDLAEALEVLANLPHGGSSTARQVWGTFWAAHQRCFKELAICAKVPFLARDALQHIHQEGCCVVFGLQGTGEAGMQSLLSQDDEQGAKDHGGGSGKKKIPRFHRTALSPNRASQCFPTLVSTVSACLTNFVKQHFPIRPFPPDKPSMPKLAPTNDEERMRCTLIQAEIDRIDALPPREPIPALVEKQEFLLEAVRHMDLPPNPLDDLIDRLGGIDVVAEMTGRSGRIVRKSKTRNNQDNPFVYSKRAGTSNNINTPAINRGEESERINLIERRLFMDGTKPAAIISDAASTGVSLHAASGSGASHKRRIHYTIELPWSADKAVQQLGRSHRSGQESAPIYKLVVTNLGGERRFAAAVSKRLASLGALTKGDRRAATGSDMSEFDLDSKYGKRALKRFYNALEENEASGGESLMGVLGFMSSESGKAKAIIEDFVNDIRVAGDPIARSLPTDDEKLRNACVLSIALAELERVGLDKATRSKADVRIFLNRLSGLMVSRQSLVFSLFMSTLEGVMKTARTSGEFEGTAEDLSATAIKIGSETDLAIDPSSGAQTKLTTLVLDRGIPFETVRALAMEEAQKASSAVTEDDNRKSQTDAKEVMSSVNEETEDGFIVNDNDESSNANKSRIAESGFYISKNKIRGRHLILFAKRKFDPSNFKTDEERVAIDPLSLMQITRPNTGANLTDKSTRDLRHAYHLALSCDKIRELSSDQQLSTKESVKENEDPQRFIKMSKKISSMWKLAFKESDSFKHDNGLAPRRQKVSLVNGPVLHILPALEAVVQFRSEKERALKIMRAQVGSRRIVGVRFPSDAEALEKLLAQLDTIHKARKNAGKAFTDEALAPICAKTMSWATTKRKTMKSFFKVTSTPSATSTKSIANPPLPKEGKKRFSSVPLSSRKKPKTTTMTMTSYFAKRK